MRPCHVEQCEEPVVARNMCGRHYQRFMKWGDPLRADNRWTGMTVEDRFWSKVDKTDTCWLWTAKLSRGGYGCFWPEKAMVSAHRWAYEHLVGPAPQGLDLDHLCRVRNCVNPAHLEPVTRTENVMRGDIGRARRENRCVNGHDFTHENTYVNPKGSRVCRTCSRESAAAYRQRKRQPG